MLGRGLQQGDTGNTRIPQLHCRGCSSMDRQLPEDDLGHTGLYIGMERVAHKRNTDINYFWIALMLQVQTMFTAETQ